MTNSSRSAQPYQAVLVDPSTGLATIETMTWDSEMQAREWACSLAHTDRVELWYNERMIGSCTPPLVPEYTDPT